MARSFSAHYTPQGPVVYSVNRPITNTSESTLGDNQNWLAGRKLVPLVVHMWHEWIKADTAADGSTYWTLGSWRRRVQKDFSHVVCVVRVKNLNNTNAGRVRFKVASSGTTADITVAANQAETTASVDIQIDPSQRHETIECTVLDPTGGNSGQVWLQSVSIYTKPLSSPLSAGVMSSGFAPIDTAETAGDLPLSTYLRTQQFENCDSIYKTRVPGTVVSYSANYDERDTAEWLYRVQSASYQLIATIPAFDIPQHCTRLGWAVQGWRSAGTAAKLKLVSQTEEAVESAAFSSTWSYGAANSGLWTTTANALTVKPGSTDMLKLYLKSDGTNYAYLAGLNIWMEDCS